MSFTQKKKSFLKSKFRATYLEQSTAVEMIMGATHDIKILDFPFFLAAVG